MEEYERNGHSFISLYDIAITMAKSNELPAKKCARCDYSWVARVLDVRECPKCKTQYWNIPRKTAKK